jgi:hypothetical protein
MSHLPRSGRHHRLRSIPLRLLCCPFPSRIGRSLLLRLMVDVSHSVPLIPYQWQMTGVLSPVNYVLRLITQALSPLLSLDCLSIRQFPDSSRGRFTLTRVIGSAFHAAPWFLCARRPDSINSVIYRTLIWVPFQSQGSRWSCFGTHPTRIPR